MQYITLTGRTSRNLYEATATDDTSMPSRMSNPIEDILNRIADKVGLVEKIPKRGKYWKSERDRAFLGG